MKVGLTLGKFAPLHKGHQHVIETALAEMDRVIVMIYACPETIDCPLDIRAQWIRDLYPKVEVLEAPDGPTMIGDTPEIKKAHEDYILKRLDGRKVTHFYNSEFYGEHVSKALGAENRLVDTERAQFPVSGTAVRNAPFGNRHFIDPRVYRDLITNVVLVGAPSTGKTTLTEALAKEFGTAWMPEYGREYWDEHQVDRRLTLEQLVEIAEGHIEREDKAILEADRYLFTDTNAITTYMFSLYYHGKAHYRLHELAKLAEKRYDLTFVCGDEIPYDDTWDRSGEVNRADFQQQIIEDLKQRGVPFVVLPGSIKDRIEIVRENLAGFRKDL
ncbi:MAG: cytidyltransferase [Lysobacterales bacterium]|nr:MAG: cytidyltransferase [Xanthomonadales bacterium]